jgi:hypothetical protein
MPSGAGAGPSTVTQLPEGATRPSSRASPSATAARSALTISAASQHNDKVYGGWLGLTADEIAGLRQDGVI